MNRELIDSKFESRCNTLYFIDEISRYKSEQLFSRILPIIANYFYYGDCGGRPRACEDAEKTLNEMIWNGYDLFQWYVTNNSEDRSCYAILHNYIEIIHLQSIYENCIKWADQNIEMCNTAVQIATWINRSIDYWLEFYKLWCRNDANSFVSTLSESFIHQLMELYEDDDFLYLLQRIATLKIDKSKDIIKFYVKDDELQIRSFAQHLLSQF